MFCFYKRNFSHNSSKYFYCSRLVNHETPKLGRRERKAHKHKKRLLKVKKKKKEISQTCIQFMCICRYTFSYRASPSRFTSTTSETIWLEKLINWQRKLFWAPRRVSRWTFFPLIVDAVKNFWKKMCKRGNLGNCRELFHFSA